MRAPFLIADDGLHDPRCTGHPSCRGVVEAFWKQLAAYRKGPPVYLPFLPGELASLPRTVLEEGICATAAISPSTYADRAALQEAARRGTAKKGRVTREIQRARDMGYVTRTFNPREFAADLRAIHRSKPVRNGRPLSGLFYLQTVKELEALESSGPHAPPACPLHHWEFWGVFQEADGQEKPLLTGYIRLRRQGDTVWYDKFMGHGDHLRNGIMYLLHFDLVARYVDTPDGVEHIIYHQYSVGGDNDLRDWKVKALFEPKYLLYANDRAWTFPRGKASQVRDMLGAIDYDLSLSYKLLQAYLDNFSVPEKEIPYLEKIILLSKSTGKDLFSEQYLTTGVFSPKEIQGMGPGMFPRHHLDGATSVAYFLWENDFGVDSVMDAVRPFDGVPPYHLAVYHDLPESARWFQNVASTTGTIMDGLAADGAEMIVVAPHPLIQWEEFAARFPDYLEKARRGVLFSMHAQGLETLGLSYEVMHGQGRIRGAREALQRTFGLPLREANVYLRNSDRGGSFWIHAGK